MKNILCIIRFDKNLDIKASHYNLSDFGFFYKEPVKEFLIFGCKEICRRLNDERLIIVDLNSDEYRDKMASLRLDRAQCNISMLENEKICIVTREPFPLRVLNNMIEEITLGNYELDYVANNYDKVEEVDKITQINNDLEETKQVLITSIEKMLERGEKIEDLVEKSEYLSNSSKTFAIKAKKLNRCCIIL